MINLIIGAIAAVVGAFAMHLFYSAKISALELSWQKMVVEATQETADAQAEQRTKEREASNERTKVETASNERALADQARIDGLATAGDSLRRALLAAKARGAGKDSAPALRPDAVRPDDCGGILSEADGIARRGAGLLERADKLSEDAIADAIRAATAADAGKAYANTLKPFM